MRPGVWKRSSCHAVTRKTPKLYQKIRPSLANSTIKFRLVEMADPAGDNVLMTGLYGIHDVFENMGRYLGLVVTKQGTTAFRNPHLGGVSLRFAVRNVNMNWLKRSLLV
jgi:hypothetical protein